MSRTQICKKRGGWFQGRFSSGNVDISDAMTKALGSNKVNTFKTLLHGLTPISEEYYPSLTEGNPDPNP